MYMTKDHSTDRMITMAAMLDRHPELRPTPDERRRVGLGRTPLGAALRRGAYSPPRAASIGKRTAHLLLWAARLYPGQYIDYADLAASLLGVSRRLLARQLVKEIILAAVSGARKVLDFKGVHFVMTVRGVGVRCTADKADAKENYLPRVQKAMLQAVRRFLDASESIDPTKLTSLHSYEENLRALQSALADADKWGLDISAERRRFAMLNARLAEAKRMRGLS